MANTIRIGTFEVSSFKVGLEDPKIYLGDILLYPTGGYKVCYAVVEDITQYTDREFEDVYDKATEKWFKLNNLNQYEEYGIYGSGRTSCEGSTSRLPQGYTEVEYIENTSTAYINLGVSPYSANGNSFIVESTFSSFTQSSFAYLISTEYTTSPYYGFILRWVNNNLILDGASIGIDTTATNIPNGDGTSAITFYSDSTTTSNNNTPITLFCGLNGSSPWRNGKGKCYSFKLTINNNIVRDLVPCKRDSDDKYGMYDIVNDVFYVSPNNVDFSGGEPVTPTDCVTTYNGKLTIDDGYEYEWNGSSWVNLGEVSGSSKTSDFTIDDINNDVTVKSSISDGDYYVISYYKHNNPKEPQYMMSYQTSNNYLSNFSGYTGSNTITPSTIIDAAIWKFEATSSANTYYIKNIHNNLYWGYQTRSSSRSLNLVGESDSSKAIVKVGVANSATTVGFVELNVNGSSYTYEDGTVGGYALNQLNGYTYMMNWWNTVGWGSDGNSAYYLYKINANNDEYPKYYSEKSEPLDNLTFNTLEDAQAYAEANCVYDGMHATIGTDRYYFDSTDENGWVKILSYYKVEDIGIGGTSGWTITGSSIYNPNSSYYDDFSVSNTTTSNKTHIAKVTIYGYDNFTYYLRSTGRTSYTYVTATNIDELNTNPTTNISYNNSKAITNTYQWNKTAGSAVNLSNYRRVTYNNLDKTVEHTFYVSFYGRNNGSYGANATLLIPKEQDNENWEQVTFSSSTNVASSQKSLYIDGNNSTSGGTQYWYYRWMVGLPSGSHSSYTNYSNYEYCPNVSSSTFTSVAGEQRQVNFTYDNTLNKTLSFRLTDGNGNVLTPSDTVYYNMTYYNSCGVSSSSSNVSFPRSQNVKVGGRFRFASSSNRHYIYGYSPNISLNTDYYVDNYQSTFDITYTKLSDEVVTITYTTYDPSDVETPAFKTDISYPYGNSGKTSNTLTSYDVPYTYSYEVKQTSNLFSASTASYSYTAGQAARTINFVLYPNNREFATVADLEAYAYAWEGMTAYVESDKYVYQNGEWVYNPSRLPQGYTEVEYVQNTGTSYLNTNFVPNQDTRVVCDMQNVTASNYPRLWGAGAWNSANGLMINYQGGYLQMSWLGKTSWTQYTSVPTSFDRKVYDVNKNYLYIDSVQIGSNTYTTRTASDPIGVFTHIGSGRPSSSSYWGQEHFKGKMYSFKVYDNGTLVRDLVPCVKDSDNTVGAYDIVNDVFYTVPTGYTTDKLIAGDPV